ncbi:MAG: hypothetical protein KDA63_20685 [Planctomycetales bacterium]|nr:hypothetical protein [Planctomycetales bacterium]
MPIASMQQLGRYKATAIALVIANAIPLIGVLFFSWSTFAIMALYWAENVIIGGVNVLKMITCAPDPDEVSLPNPSKAERADDFDTALASLGQSRTSLTAIHHASKLFFVPFFTIHYGMFCFVHGVFVLVLFGRDSGFLAQPSDPFDAVPQLGEQLLHGGMLLALISLGLSHLFSFVKNYLIGGEYRRITVPALMIQPYGRVVVMHLALLFGGFATVLMGSSVVALLILVVGKTVMDVHFHLREHRADEANRGDGFGQVETR